MDGRTVTTCRDAGTPILINLKLKTKGEKRDGLRSMGNNSNNFGDCTGGGATHSHGSSGGTEHMV